MSDNLVIQTERISKVYDGHEVVRNCNINVERNTIYCLIGRNGAGKTTLFKILLGLVTPTNGKATVLGLDSNNDNLNIIRRTGSVIETPVFYEHLSATENLQIHLDYMDATNNIERILQIVGLTSTGKQPVSTFSLGMRQRLAIARALIHKPDLLILDEPINGMDPIGIKEMRDLFRTLTMENITILLSSHILSEVEQVADRIGFIVDGETLCEKTPDEINSKYPEGIEAYFMKITQRGV